MSTTKQICHVAIVVDNIDSALNFWRDGLGIELAHIEEVEEQNVRVAFLPIGESEIELVEPTTDDTGVARFLNNNGPGMHHVCLEVDDIKATLGHLKTQGFRLINEEPIVGAGGKRVAFVHPEATQGVLVELYEA